MLLSSLNLLSLKYCFLFALGCSNAIFGHSLGFMFVSQDTLF